MWKKIEEIKINLCNICLSKENIKLIYKNPYYIITALCALCMSGCAQIIPNPSHMQVLENKPTPISGQNYHYDYPIKHKKQENIQ